MQSARCSTYLAVVLLSSAGIAQGWTDTYTPPNYVLGPDDQVLIRATDVDELNGKLVAIDLRGYVDIPLVGNVLAAHKTIEEFRGEIETRLRPFVNDPRVSVTVAEYRSQPVSILGAVNKPGVYYLTGENTLLQLISKAGGLSESAGNVIQITRTNAWGRIPLSSATEEPGSNVTRARVQVKSLMDARAPADNITIKPNDIIAVQRAEMVYVIGAVRRPGGFLLNDKEQMSVLEALALAQGLERVSAAAQAKIIRKSTTSERQEIPADLKNILSGKAVDLPLKPNDILFIPTSAARNASLRALEAAIQLGTGVVIYRR